ncbi:cupin domain-containing protein [Ktedonosporobacter rubrisoli]|nr:cupin domain-containing protein [Ktedonosporobacter rubrisoli]
MNIPHAESVNLETLVAYQSGKLVSLPLTQLPNLSVILFAIDQGEAIGAHSAPGDALLQILDGAAEITIGKQTLTVKKGEAVVMPADVPHALAAKERFKMLLTFIKER